MNDELKEHYNKVLEIRNQAVKRLVKAKEEYVATGNADEFILEMYDEEIDFLQKSVSDMLNILK